MSTNMRFVLDTDGNIIDKLNRALTPKINRFHGEPEDDIHLREAFLYERLSDMVDDLVIHTLPEKVTPSGEKYHPINEEAHAVSWAIYKAIQASHLKARNPSVSGENCFAEKLKSQNEGWKAITSIGLFCDDVERLLQEIYDDIERTALQDIVEAVSIIVEAFTRYMRKDLWQEHQYAKDSDCYLGLIGWPVECGISGSQLRYGYAAHSNLQKRAQEVLEKPSAFSKYSVQFAKTFNEESKTKERPEDSALVIEIPFLTRSATLPPVRRWPRARSRQLPRTTARHVAAVESRSRRAAWRN